MRTIPMLAAALLTASLVIGPTPVGAQTATDVVCTGCIGTTDIATGAITGVKIKNGTIYPAKLAPTAKPAGVSFNTSGFGPALAPIPITSTVAISVSLTAPAAGFVVVNVAGYLRFDAGSTAAATCELTQGTVIDGARIQANGINGAADWRVPIAATRGFSVAAGPQTFNFVCVSDTVDDVRLYSTDITAVFTPQQY